MVYYKGDRCRWKGQSNDECLLNSIPTDLRQPLALGRSFVDGLRFYGGLTADQCLHPTFQFVGLISLVVGFVHCIEVDYA